MHSVLRCYGNCRYVQHYDDHYVDDWRPPPDIDTERAWGDEWFFEAPHERESGFVRLDAHIMSAPAIADIDGDGQDEIVVATSYFFDPEYYSDPVSALFPFPQTKQL